MKSENIFEKKESNVRSYCRKYPVVFEKAKGSFLFTEDEEKYIDFLAMAGSMNYGHNNEYIKDKIMEYLSEDNIVNSLDMYTVAKRCFLETFVNKILEPRDLDYKIMCCGPTGTNAVEAALKLARKNTGRKNVIAFSGAFHGMTLGSLALTTDSTSRSGAGVSLNNVTFVPYEDTLDINVMKYLEWIVSDDHSGIEKPAAMVLETIQAEGGINIASIEWLQQLRDFCTNNGIIMIVDDIQVGNGRSGSFFSFERAGIVPDMVVLSKSISGFGTPMSLLLMKPEYDIFKPAEHNGTFRGNDLAFIGGKAAIEYFVNEDIPSAVKKKGNIVENYLKDICEKHPSLSYRGMGLIWGVDFSKIDAHLALECVHSAFENKLILEVAGRKDGVLKIMPPLTIDESTLVEGLSIVSSVIDDILKSYEAK